jgi:erythromycin esterase-like protein
MRILKIALLVAAAGILWFLVRYVDWFDDSAQPLEPGLVAAIRRGAHPLSTVEAAQGAFDELRFLKPLVDGKRLVMAGEAAPGVHEFFAMKHRLFEFLVRERGFTVFALPAPYQAGLAVDRYVAGGPGELQDAVRPLGYWAWNTEEFRALIQWMRDYNREQPGRPRLKFYGFDGYIPGGSNAGREERLAANVKWILDREGPQSKVFLWAGNIQVAHLPERMGGRLNRLLGNRQYAIGFEFDQGGFRSRGPAGLRMHSVEPAPPGYYAQALSRVGSLVFFVDLASLRGDEMLDRWLMRPQWSRQYDDTYWFSSHFRKLDSVQAPLPDLYDDLIFVEHVWPVTPAVSPPV